MPYKCNKCGKLLAVATDGVKCANCTLVFHKACLNISPDSPISPKWQCRGCKPRREIPAKPCTPVSHSDNDAEENSSDAHIDDVNPTASLVHEMRLLREEISSVAREMSLFREQITQLNLTMVDFGKRVSDVEGRLNVLEQCRESQKDVNTDSTLINMLRAELNEREQENLANDIEIAGLEEKPGESSTNIVQLIAQKIGVEIDERDIVSAERSGPRRASSGDSGRERPRTIVVRLARRAVREELRRSARVRRSVDSTGIVDGECRKFYINERLTPKNRFLFFKAREAERSKGWRFVWTKGGRIYARHNVEAAVHRIRNETDIQVKIWFQNRRAKWKRVKAGLASGSHAGGKNSSGTKIVVPIPVHVNRFAVRTQHHQMEKQNLQYRLDRNQPLPGSLLQSQTSAFLSATKICDINRQESVNLNVNRSIYDASRLMTPVNLRHVANQNGRLS